MKLLFICTGNICRSPMAEHLLRASLVGRGVHDVEISSAGTRGLVGHPIEPNAAAAIGHLDTSAFRGRRLQPELVADADLVLCAAREHRREAVTMAPRAMSYAFTIRELDRLLAPVDPGRLGDRRTAVVTAAAAQRGLVPTVPPEDDDISDPYGGPAAGYPPTARLIEASLTRLVEMLAGPGTVG